MADDSLGARPERWVRADRWSFWAFAIGFLLENYIFSLAPIANGWVHHIPKAMTSLLLAWAPIWLIIGIMVAGPVADRVGSKNTFYMTMALYGLGGIGIIFFSPTYVLLLLFLAVLLFASGGEMNTIMVASHEIMPRQHRSKTIMLELNFINLGGVILATLAIATHAYNSSVTFQKATVGVALLLVLGVLLLARVNTPESLRWLIKSGQRERAQQEAARYYGEQEGALRLRLAEGGAGSGSAGPRASMAVRWYATLTTSFAGAAGFGLMTYVVGPYFFKCTDPEGCARKRKSLAPTKKQIEQFAVLQIAWKPTVFELDPHVVRRQRERCVSQADIRNVLLHGQLVEYRHHRPRSVRATIVSRLRTGRVLQVVVEWQDHGMYRVITVLDIMCRAITATHAQESPSTNRWWQRWNTMPINGSRGFRDDWAAR